MKLQGRVAVITGAASAKGLGFASARKLAEEGAAVVLTDIDGAAVLARAGELAARGYRALGLAHDVSSERAWAEIERAVLDAFGRLDILVNNAALVIRESIDAMSADDFRRQLDVNLTGVFLGSAIAVRLMRAGGSGGSIINISSVAGLVGVPRLAGYNASKGGVRLLSKNIALEGAPDGIRCNSLHPGMIWTDMMQAAADRHVQAGAKLEAVTEGMLQGVPMKRFGEPEDIANAVLFLASDDSRYMTGTELVIDGGLTAH